MVPSLRKRHRRIWLFLGILLPLLFIASVLVIPEPVYQEELHRPADDQTIPSEPEKDQEQ